MTKIIGIENTERINAELEQLMEEVKKRTKTTITGVKIPELTEINTIDGTEMLIIEGKNGTQRTLVNNIPITEVIDARNDGTTQHANLKDRLDEMTQNINDNTINIEDVANVYNLLNKEVIDAREDNQVPSVTYPSLKERLDAIGTSTTVANQALTLATSTNKEVEDARGGQPTLGDRLDGIDTEINDVDKRVVKNEGDIANIQQDFNVLNQEVIDARTDNKTPIETHNSLKERLDSDYDYLNSEIEKTNTHLSKIRANHLTVSVKDFGAKGDGVTDDRLAIQTAIDSLSGTGGVVYFPPTHSSYLLKSKHDSKDCCLYVGSSNIRLKGGANGLDSFNGFLEADIESDSLLLIDTDTYSFEIDSLVLDGNNKVNYVFKCDEKYSPYMTLNNTHFVSGKIYAASIATYMSVFNKCIFGMSGGGLKLDGVNGGPVTSLTLNSCYTLQNSNIGYDLGHLTYCTFNSCASDRNDIAYYLRAVYGCNFNGCGCEGGRKAFHAENARMCGIQTFYGLNMGTNQSQQVDYLMEFVSGVNITLNGIYFRDSKMFKKTLGLTGSGNGNENITVLDGSLGNEDIDYVPNLVYTHPIKLLRRDESTKDEQITTTIGELQQVINNLPKMINHEYTINITNATYNNNFTLNVSGFDGSGFIKLVFNGGVINNLAEWQPIKLKNNNLTIMIGDVTLGNTFSHNQQEVIRCDNTRNLIVHNVEFNNLVQKCGSAISSRNGSHVISANNNTSGSFGSDGQLAVYLADEWSTIKIN